ncbi:pentatricopeptide repeat-containing protein At5g48910-like [Elaeis guineensis]|uniref:Pentatricopeptide repeat-containing protein At5g48910-like n=1 Tax=Elaeis guineensis var. tenera TaxID=51953 RepID=A0A6I9SHE2_ELAGV|nr:pentatricopeptide repeat-containing protein At5g48910-like [Elaeis guineensis]
MTSVASIPFSIPQAIPATQSPPVQNSNLSLLQLCTHLHEANQIHALMIKSSQATDAYSAGRLAEFYAISDHGSLQHAEKVLRSLEHPPTFIFNTLMRGHLNRRIPLQSIHIYHQMLLASAEPDHFTFTFALKASTQLRALPIGHQLHAHIVKHGLHSNPHIRNKLIHLYAVCGRIGDARKVFDGSTELDVVAWNSMLEGYADNKDGGSLHDLFSRMPARDVVSWNTMMAYHIEMGEFEEAIMTFRSMQESHECRPNRVTLVSVLSALSHLGALGQGQWAHAYINRHGIELDENLSSALINMYSKCGCIEGAVYTFEVTNCRSADAWNAMISGFTTNGQSSRAVELFSRMESSAVEPNRITFACVLNACSHGGLVDKGIEYFRKMNDVYGTEPDIGHYGCMVDLFSRAGLFEKAEEMIRGMPMEPDAVMWKAVVGACRIHRNLELGEKAGFRLVKAAPDDHAAYVLLSNIFAMANNWNGVHKVRKMMSERGVRKVPGCSSIELGGVVHEFIAGDVSQPRKKEIYEMMDEIGERLKLAGYEPDTTQVLLDIDEEEVKESSLALHSEKIAVAFGLISTKAGTTIRVVKNLRMCGDCHSAIKLLTEIYERDIIVRDANRFHHFRKGSCSCMDYW